jgi:hypothetical protein
MPSALDSATTLDWGAPAPDPVQPTPPAPQEDPKQTDARQIADSIAVQRQQLNTDQQDQAQQKMSGAEFAAQGVPALPGLPTIPQTKGSSSTWDSLGAANPTPRITLGAPPQPATTGTANDLQQQRDAAVAQAAQQQGDKLTLDQHAAVTANADYQNAQRQFGQIASILDRDQGRSPTLENALASGDAATAHAALDSRFQSYYNQPQANAKAGLFNDDLTPAAQQYRANIDAAKAQGHAAIDAMVDAQQRATAAQNRITAANAPQQPAAPATALDGGQSQTAAATPFAPTEAPYRVDPAGGIAFDPNRLQDGLLAAFKDGAIDQDKLTTLLPKAQAAQDAIAAQQKLLANDSVASKLKALGYGAGKGAAFLAGAGPGAEAGAAIGAFGGPLDWATVPAGAAIGGLITGGLASFGADKTLRKLGEYSDTIKSFTDAADAHPYYDAAGNLIAFGSGVPMTVANLAGDAAIRAASGASTGTIAKAIAAKVGGAAAANVAIDTIIKQGAHALGLSDEGQTLPGAAQAALVGAFVAGHGIEIGKLSPNDIASAVVKERMGVPMTKDEIETANAFKSELIKQRASGNIPQNPSNEDVENALRRSTGEQATMGGKPYGVTAVKISPESNEAPSQPAPQPAQLSDQTANPKTPGPSSAAQPPAQTSSGSSAPASRDNPTGSSESNSYPIPTPSTQQGQPQSAPLGTPTEAATASQSGTPAIPTAQQGAKAESPQLLSPENQADTVASGQTATTASPSSTPRIELAARQKELAALPADDTTKRPLIEGRIKELQAVMGTGETGGGPSPVPVADQLPAEGTPPTATPEVASQETRTQELEKQARDLKATPPKTSPPVESPAQGQPPAPSAEKERTPADEARVATGEAAKPSSDKKPGGASDAPGLRPSPTQTPEAFPAPTNKPSTPETPNKSESSTQPAKPRTLATALHEDDAVKLALPKGASHVEAINTKGQVAHASIVDVRGGNILKGGGPYSKITPGKMQKGRFVPIEGKAELTPPKGEKAPVPEIPGLPAEPAVKPTAPAKAEETHSPEAAHALKLANAALKLHEDELKALGHPLEFVTKARDAEGELDNAGISTDLETGRIEINPEKFAESIAAVRERAPKGEENAKALAFVKNIVAEEVAHVATIQYAKESPENMARLLRLHEDEDLMKRAADVYGSTWNELGEFGQAAEAARILLRGPEKLTEATYKFLADFLNWLKEKLTNLSKDTRELIAGIEEKLGKYRANEEQEKASAKVVEAQQRKYDADLTNPAKVVEMARRPDGLVVLNADDLVGGSPAMKQAKAITDPNRSFQQGQKVYDELKPAADRARQAAFDYLLKQPAKGDVVFTIGGPGSGKSTFINKVKDADFVLDAVHAQPGLLGDRIQQALDSGRQVRAIFILRDPGEAMRGNLQRALVEKRMATAEGLAQSHAGARREFAAVAERFAGNPNVDIVSVESGSLKEAPVPPLSVDEARQKAHSVVDAITNGTDANWKHGALPAAVRERALDVEGADRGDAGARASGTGERDGGSGAPGRPAPRDNSGALKSAAKADTIRQFKKTFDGLFGASPKALHGANPEPIEQRGFPVEKKDEANKLVHLMIRDGINTPEKMAQFLDEMSGGKARPFSKALWRMLGSVDTDLPDGPSDWAPIYASLTPEEKSPAPRAFKFTGPRDEHFASNPLIQEIANQGGLASKSTVQKRWSPEKWRASKGEWDDAPALAHPTHNQIYKPNGLMPNEMASALVEAHLLPPGSSETEMWKAIGDISKSSNRLRQQDTAQRQQQATAAKQEEAFDQDARQPHAGTELIPADSLKVGDVVEVNGEKMKVIDIDPDTFDATLEDHSKYGIQQVKEGEILYGQLDAAPEEENHFPGDEKPQANPLALEKPESVEEQRTRMEAAQKKRDEAKAKADMIEKAKAPLKGDAGDMTADMFGGGETPLFNERRGVVSSQHDEPTGSRVEPDREDATLSESGGKGGLSTESGATDRDGASVEGGRGESGNAGDSGPLSADVPSAPHGGDSDQSIREPASEHAQRPAGSERPGGSGGPDATGVEADRPAEGDADSSLVVPSDVGTLEGSGGAGEGSVTTPSGYHPALSPEQAGDVAFIERRLNDAKKPGVLLTNGTGTGKTFSGLGAVHRMLEKGEKHVLVVVPFDKIANDWLAAARGYFGVKDSVQLQSITDAGEGNRIVVTTYANFGQNNALAKRPWGAVVADEAHYLSQAKDGDGTNALDAFRALTWHPNGIYKRAEMELPEVSAKLKKLSRLKDPSLATRGVIDGLRGQIRERERELKARASAMGEAGRPKAILLSATPFAYHKSLDYAEGYLFDHGPEPQNRGYNTPSARDRFFIENFGYRMRNNKLTQPENATATGILERRFAEKLMKDGAMSGRALDVPHDYSRDFVLTENSIGNKVDEVMKALDTNPRLSPLKKFIGIGDYLQRRYLLEAIKAEEAVDRIQQHLDMGRKVVVFHDYKKGGSDNPLRPIGMDENAVASYMDKTGKYQSVRLGDAYDELRSAVPDYDQFLSALDGLQSPLATLQKAFPEIGIFNGDVPAAKRRAVVDQFNTSGGKMNVILVQRASGKEGISLHDRDGKHQRALIDLGIPGRPTDAIQCEGRPYRFGVKSNAVFEYLTTGTNFERWTFAQTIAQRASTAENLAMGERARSLLQSFANGYNDATAMAPSQTQGTGGKALDRAREHGDPYDNAVALYYTNQKKTSRNKSSEGVDYFATPEPLAYKMVEWAGIRPGEKVLEPSAGHGAIARFFPDSTNRHAVEPSNELAGRLALNATDTEIHQQRFEDYNTINKFDAVVMNPPFGTAGKTAMEHVAKAAQHLRDGGRLVALIPMGSSMESRFNAWMDSDAAKGFSQRAEIKLPTSTFERAGTGAATRVVVLDKDSANTPGETVSRDLTDAADIKELFSRLKHLSVPDRPEKATPATETPLAPEQVKQGFASVRQAVETPKPQAALSTVPTPTRDNDFSPADFKHTKTGAPIYVAKIMRRLNSTEYAAANAKAKALDGNYSSFRGAGAIPGFHFRTAEARDSFIGTPIQKPPQQLGGANPADAKRLRALNLIASKRELRPAEEQERQRLSGANPNNELNRDRELLDSTTRMSEINALAKKYGVSQEEISRGWNEMGSGWLMAKVRAAMEKTATDRAAEKVESRSSQPVEEKGSKLEAEARKYGVPESTIEEGRMWGDDWLRERIAAARRNPSATSPSAHAHNPIYSTEAGYVFRDMNDRRTTGPGKVEMEPKLREVAARLEQETQHPWVTISDLMEGAGLPPTATGFAKGKGILMGLHREGKVQLGALDWSLAKPRERAWGVTRGGEAYLAVRFNPGKDDLGDAGNNLRLHGASPMRAAYDAAADAIEGAKDELKLRGTKEKVAYKTDAVSNRANYHGQQAGNSIKLDLPDAADRAAMPFVIEAGGDPKKLVQFKAQIAASNDPKLAKKFEPVIDRAIAEFSKLNAARANHDQLMKDSMAELKAHNIDVGEVENYVTRKLEAPDAVKEALPNPLFSMGSGKGSNPRYFAKGRSFETLADAIEAGYPPISTDLADLDAHRIEAGKRLVFQKEMFDELRNTPAPTDGKPIIGKFQQRKLANGDTEQTTPRGYSVVNAAGTPLVIHDDLASTFRNLFGESAVRQTLVGRAGLKAAAFVKHASLAVDTFHIGRMLFKMAAAGGGRPVMKRNSHLAWNIHKGRALLEYSDADLGRAEAMHDITKEEAAYARANRPKIERLMQYGMNVGKVSDNLLEQAKLHLPIVSKLNDWIFTKLSRSAMLQSSLGNLERNLKNPAYTEEQAYRQTAKEMNELFGNLQSQGIFKSKTLQDIARLVFLAPNWAESQFRNEARAYGQGAKAAFNAARGKGFRLGNAARIFAAGLVGLLAVNQILNFMTRRQSTFQNKEDGHKLDAWIPGGKLGYWFDPLEIAGEYSFAAMKYLAQHENPVDVASHIVSNKLSPLARASKEELTGRDYSGRHFLNNTDRARSAISEVLPVPLVTGAVLERDPRQPLGFRYSRQPGSIEKQLLQSVGMKVANAQSARSEMFAIAQPFRADRSSGDTAGEYTELRRALDNDDMAAAKSEIQWLQNRGKSMAAISHAVGIRSNGTVAPEMFAGNADREAEMLATLTPHQKEVYAQAQQDHADNAAKFLKLIGGVPPQPAKQPRRAPALAAMGGSAFSRL